MATLDEGQFELPESYAVNRVSLAVRDPECLFISWDVDARSLETLRAQVGERVVAVSPLTLRVGEAGADAPAIYLPPSGARSRYVSCAPGRSYRAELGLTLPWGEFRRLAQSDSVDTPGVGPSPEPARRVLRYPNGSDVADADKAGFTSRPGWQERAGPPSHDGRGQRPGASESFGPGGASDRVHP